MELFQPRRDESATQRHLHATDVWNHAILEYLMMYGCRSQLAEFADLSNMVFPCCLCVIDVPNIVVKLVSSFFVEPILGRGALMMQRQGGALNI